MQLNTVKADLRIIHSADDALLLQYMQAARAEALQFCNLEEFVIDTDGDESQDIQSAMMLLVRAMYEQVEPDKLQVYRNAAEAKLMPYRVCMGV